MSITQGLADLQLNGSASISSGKLRLSGSICSAWTGTEVALPALVQFTYSVPNPTSISKRGDGFTVTLYSADEGTAALGLGGSSLGLAPIGYTPSTGAQAFPAAHFVTYDLFGSDTDTINLGKNTSGSPHSYVSTHNVGTDGLFGTHNVKIFFGEDTIIAWQDGVEVLRSNAYSGSLPSSARVGFTSSNGASSSTIMVSNIAITDAYVAAPTGFTATRNPDDGTTIGLAWNAVTATGSLNGYDLEVFELGTSNAWRTVGSPTAEAASYPFTGAFEKAEYKFRLRAVIDGLPGSWVEATATGESVLTVSNKLPGQSPLITETTFATVGFSDIATGTGVSARVRAVLSYSSPAIASLSTSANFWLLANALDIETGTGLELASTLDPTTPNTVDPAYAGSVVVSRIAATDVMETTFPYRVALDIVIPSDVTASQGISVTYAMYVGTTAPNSVTVASEHYIDTVGSLTLFPFPLTPPANGDATGPLSNDTSSDVGIGIGWDSGSAEIPSGPVYHVDPPNSNGEVCVKNAYGEALVCAKLPDGATANPYVTVRRDGNWMFVDYNGKVIITYELDTIQYPGLNQSGAWIGFYNKNTGKPVVPPTGGRYSFPPLTGLTYRLFAYDNETPLGFDHPLWKRAHRFQPYTVLVQADGSCTAEIEPLQVDVDAASQSFLGGHAYTIPTATAINIAQSGFYRWLSLEG